MKNKLLKSISIVSIFVAFLVITLIPTFAATYNPIVPIEFNNYGSYLTVVAFPGAHALPLYENGSSVRNYLDNDDYNNEEGTHILFGDLFNNGNTVPYIQISLTTNYASLYFNGVLYNGSTTAPGVINEPQLNVTSIISYPLANSLNTNLIYYYTFNIVLGNYVDYDTVYNEGYNQGFSFGYVDGLEDGKEQGYQTGYTDGYDNGVNASESQALGHNLLGDTLNAPMNALNQFILYDPPGDIPPITLGTVLGGVISLTLFLAFLKIFSGG